MPERGGVSEFRFPLSQTPVVTRNCVYHPKRMSVKRLTLFFFALLKESFIRGFLELNL